MSTYSTTDQPLHMTRSRGGSFPMRWQSPSAQPIDLTGFAITAEVSWRGIRRALVVSRPDDAGGRFVVHWTDGDLADLPPGRVSELHVRIVDTAGENHDCVFPVDGEVP